MKHLGIWLGLRGIASSENHRAIQWGRHLELPMIMLALWSGAQSLLVYFGHSPQTGGLLFDWVILSLFMLETTVLTLLVDNKKRYLLGNWTNLLIITSGLFLVAGIDLHVETVRLLRLLVIVGLAVHVAQICRDVLVRHQLGYTLVVSAILVLIAGTLITGIDPAINNISDGIWWAWVTITTVGYGDIVPVSLAGKLFGSLLIFFGIGLFALLTANISAFLIDRDENQEKHYLNKTLQDIRTRLIHLEEKIDNLNNKEEEEE